MGNGPARLDRGEPTPFGPAVAVARGTERRGWWRRGGVAAAWQPVLRVHWLIDLLRGFSLTVGAELTWESPLVCFVSVKSLVAQRGRERERWRRGCTWC